MRSALRTAILSAAVAVGAVASTSAWAQPEPQGPRPPSARFQAMHEAHERQRAQDLKAILRLRPDQEPALTAFLQSHEPPGPRERPDLRREGLPPQDLTTPQRLDEMARREAEHARARQARTEKLRAFYAALDPQQRQAFDALERMQRGGHGGGGMGHGGWGHGGFGVPAPRG